MQVISDFFFRNDCVWNKQPEDTMFSLPSHSKYKNRYKMHHKDPFSCYCSIRISVSITLCVKGTVRLIIIICNISVAGRVLLFHIAWKVVRGWIITVLIVDHTLGQPDFNLYLVNYCKIRHGFRTNLKSTINKSLQYGNKKQSLKI